MPLSIRPLEPADRAAWEPLFVGYLAFYKREMPAEVMAECWRRFMDKAHVVEAHGAFEDEKLLGIVHFFPHANSSLLQDICYLQDLFTVPEARGKGVGRALIEHVYAIARERGWARVYWHTHETNAEAQVLYNKVAERSGFIVYRHNL